MKPQNFELTTDERAALEVLRREAKEEQRSPTNSNTERQASRQEKLISFLFAVVATDQPFHEVAEQYGYEVETACGIWERFKAKGINEVRRGVVGRPRDEKLKEELKEMIMEICGGNLRLSAFQLREKLRAKYGYEYCQRHIQRLRKELVDEHRLLPIRGSKPRS